MRKRVPDFLSRIGNCCQRQDNETSRCRCQNASHRLWCAEAAGWYLRGGDRKRYGEGCPVSGGGLDLDSSLVILDDLPANWQTIAVSVCLGRDFFSKKLCFDLITDPGTIVLHEDPYLVP